MMKSIILILTTGMMATAEPQSSGEAMKKFAGNTDKNSAKKSCCSGAAAPAASEVGEESIYQLSSIWRDDSGKKRLLKSLTGKIQVVTMGYSSCKYACPQLLADLRAIESGLSAEVREKIGFGFISIDPAADTPERLAAYRQEHKLDSGRWTLLTGDAATVQELAVVLGIQYRKTSGSDFAHSNVITVLNAKGEIIYRQEGLATSPDGAIKAIKDVLAAARK